MYWVCSKVTKIFLWLQVPQTEDEWKKIQNEYYLRWNFPNCCGALDGTHIVIRNAPHSGSEYFNYKGIFSLILFACVDANFCFRYIFRHRRASDAAFFAKSSLNAALEDIRNTFPNDGVFVADDAFPLRTYILKPTHLSRKQKIFNYRLSRARRVVEKAFRILVNRFFERPIAVGIDKVDGIVKAALALHNWLRTSSGEKYTSTGSSETENLNTSCNYTVLKSDIRDQYAELFSGHGAVLWQLNMINDDE
nr:unnamed protein product [Callosobruchus analis]